MGVALFLDAQLTRAFLIKTDPFVDIFAAIGRVDEIVVERMKIYPSARAKGDPGDMLNIEFMTGQVVGGIRFKQGDVVKVTGYLPHEWKKILPKEIVHERALRMLQPDERKKIDLPKAKKTQLDVLDAVALGLVHVRRLFI